uniref:Vacuolar ATPase assembly protein VMA22 n=1 Tax=Physcomitrium patens TaxID=3218 RepID=A0A7I4F840_PHYPA
MALKSSPSDQDFICCLDSVHDLLTLRHSLSLLLSQGWMDMAKARYSMGLSRISQPLFSLKPHSASARILVSFTDDGAESSSQLTLVKLDARERNSHSTSYSHTSEEKPGHELEQKQKPTRSKAVPTDWSQDEDAAYRQLMGGVDDSDSDSEASVSYQVLMSSTFVFYASCAAGHLFSFNSDMNSLFRLWS